MRWFSKLGVLHAAISLILSTSSSSSSSSPLSLALANPLPQPPPHDTLFGRSTNSLTARNSAINLSGNQLNLTSGAYPRATLLSDGSLLATITEFDTSANTTTIRAWKSTDSGATWARAGVIDTGDTNKRDIDNAFPLQLNSGRVLVAFRNHDRDPTSGAYTFFRITVCSSDDDGASWKYLSTPAQDSGSIFGNWEPFLRNDDDDLDTLQLFYSRQGSASDQNNLVRTSTDGGATWTSATTVSGQDSTNSNDGMMGVTNYGINGRAVAVFESRSANTGYFELVIVKSPSGGLKDDWGSRKVIYTAGRDRAACKTRTCNASAPQIVNMADGALVVSFMTDEDDPQDRYPNGASTKLILSKDSGTTWTVDPVVIASGRETRWPGMIRLNRRDLLVLAQDPAGMAWAQKVTVD